MHNLITDAARWKTGADNHSPIDFGLYHHWHQISPAK